MRFRVRAAAQGQLGARSGSRSVYSGGLAGQLQGRLQRPVRAHLLHQRRFQRLTSGSTPTTRRTGWCGIATNLLGSFDGARSCISTPGSTGPSATSRNCGSSCRRSRWTRRCARPIVVDRAETPWSVPTESTISACEPRLPDPLPVRTGAAVLSVRRLWPWRLSIRESVSEDTGQAAARQFRSARRRAAAGEVQLPLRMKTARLRRAAAAPNKPKPRRPSVAGSGTEVEGRTLQVSVPLIQPYTSVS